MGPTSLRVRDLGPYTLEDTIGEGGMGVVYRAVDRASGELVAIKVVRIADENVIASIRREIFALRSLQHPGVVSIVADGVERGQPWYAMELLAGDTLADYIDAAHAASASAVSYSSDTVIVDGRAPAGEAMRAAERASARVGTHATELMSAPTLVPPARSTVIDDTMRWIQSLCEPLAYVHGKGLVHRDLKPANVFLRPSGRVVLADFGLSLIFGEERARERLDVAGRVLGTPPYMAPEQIRGDLVDARADLYALGCIVYECLTGEPPFVGGPIVVLQRHLHEAPRAPSSLVPEVPPELDRLVLRLLAKQPRQRIGYAADVAASLRRLGAEPLRLSASQVARPYLYRPRLAGRDGVLADLERALPSREGPSGSLWLIAGHSGVGKTRLAMELATSAARRGLRVETAHGGDVLGAGGALAAPPLSMLRPLFTAIADRCQRSGRDYSQRVVGERAPILTVYEPAFSTLAGVGTLTEPPPLPLQAARARSLEALATTVQRYVSQEPTLLVLDDLQWADELSMTLLEYLEGERVASLPLVIVATYRSEEASAAVQRLASRADTEVRVIGALDTDAVRVMVGDMLALYDPPSSLLELVGTECEGNPFFIAEYLRAAVDAQVLQRDDNSEWTLGSVTSRHQLLAALPVPGGVRDLVDRRVRSFSAGARKLAELASVMGREIDGDALLSASALVASWTVTPPPSVSMPRLEAGSRSVGDEPARHALEELRARELLEEGKGGALHFAHEKLRELVYAGIAAAPRASLHRAAGLAIEATATDARGRALVAPQLAHHFEAAGDFERALDYLEIAGEHALASAASGDAQRFFERALELAKRETPTRPSVSSLRRGKWQRRLGEAAYNQGDLERARHHLDAALRRFRSLGKAPIPGALTALSALARQLFMIAGLQRRRSSDTSALHREAALAAERLSQTYFFLNERTAAFSSALASADHAQHLGPSPELARGCAVLGVAFGYTRQRALVDYYERTAEKVAEDVGDPHAISFTAFLRGLSALGDGRHRDARRLLSRARAVANRSGDVRSVEEITPLLSHAHAVAGLCVEALALDAEVLESGRRTKNAQAVAWGKATRASTLTFMGKAEEAAALFEDIDDIVRRSADQTQMLVQGLVALDYLMLGRIDDARARADETRTLAARCEPAGFHCYLGYVAMCEVYLAECERLHAARGGEPVDEGSELFRAAAGSVDALVRCARTFRLARPAALTFVGIERRLAGDVLGARTSIVRAIELASALDLPFDEGRAHHQMARLASRADPARRWHILRAEQCFDRAGAGWWRERVTALV